MLMHKIGVIISEVSQQYHKDSLAKRIHNWNEKVSFLLEESAIEDFKNTAHFKLLSTVAKPIF